MADSAPRHLRDLLPGTPVVPTTEQEQDIKARKPSRPPQLFSVNENLLMARLLFVARQYFQLGVTSVIPILTAGLEKFHWYDEHSVTQHADWKKRAQKVNNRVSRINELGSEVLMKWLQFDYPDPQRRRAMFIDIEDWCLTEFESLNREKRAGTAQVGMSPIPTTKIATSINPQKEYVKPKDFGVMSVRRRLKFTEIENRMVRHWLVRYGLDGAIHQLLQKYGQFNLMDDKDATQRVKHIFQKMADETNGRLTAHNGQGSYLKGAPDGWTEADIPQDDLIKFEQKLISRASEARGMANQQHTRAAIPQLSSGVTTSQYDPTLEGQPADADLGSTEFVQFPEDKVDAVDAASVARQAILGQDEAEHPAKKARLN